MNDLDSLTLAEGWHWLIRRSDGAARIAYFDRRGWRVADAMGRTTCRRRQQVERLYRYLRRVQPPDHSSLDKESPE